LQSEASRCLDPNPVVCEVQVRGEMKFKAVSLALLSVTLTPIFAQLPEDLKRKFDEAERRIVRLPPSAFSELPRNVVRELQRRGCTKPQEAYTKRRHNVIRGESAKHGQTDWTVLCSVKGVSTILVFWNGSETNPAAVAPMEDRNFLQGITDQIGYSRGITPVGEDFIMRHYDAYGGPKPLPSIEHQGIDDAFIEKASVVWYFYSGKWLMLTGAD
jgi:hypothetical protein